jgi:hypothetical protein
VDGSLQSYHINFRQNTPSLLIHDWSYDGVSTNEEILDPLQTGQTGFPSTINFVNGIHTFYRNGTTLMQKWFVSGGWNTEAVAGTSTFAGGMSGSPGTAVDYGGLLQVVYISGNGSLIRYWSNNLWQSEHIVAPACSGSGSHPPTIGSYHNQLHVLAFCGNTWVHYWQNPNGVWSNELLGANAHPGNGDLALAADGTEFNVVGLATDNTLFRWWYADGYGWREQRISSESVAGRVQVGYFFGSLHATWGNGSQLFNGWINGSSWSSERLQCTNACNDADNAVANGVYFLVSTDSPTDRWGWTPSGGWVHYYG